MKYIFVKTNSPWTKNGGDIKQFESETQRDEWVNTNLFNGEDYKELLQNSKAYNNVNLNPLTNTVELEKVKDPQNGNANMVITCNDDLTNITFHHINGSTTQTNQGMVDYELETSIWLTYIGILSNMQDFKLQKGHVPFNEYFKYEFDPGEKAIVDIKTIQSDLGKLRPEQDTLWVIAIRQSNATLNGKNGIRMRYIFDGNRSFFTPYQVLIAPIEPIAIKDQNGTNKNSWSAEQLLQDVAGDGNTISIRIVKQNYFTIQDFNSDGSITGDYQPQPDQTFIDNPFWQIILYSGEPYGYLTRLNIDRVKTSTLETGNQYEVDLEPYREVNDISLLEGLRKVDISLEGKKNFKIPPYLLLESKQVKFRHDYTFTLAESLESIIWKSDKYKNTPTEDNTWENTSELNTYTNQLDQYKANNPINAKLDFIKPLAQLANPLNFINPSTAIAGGVNAITQEFGTYLNRQNMKLSPNEVNGNMSGINELVLTNKGSQFVLKEYEFYGRERQSIIDNIFREGIAFDNTTIVKSYADIKRPKFNFMIVTNYEESNINITLPNEIITALNEIFINGVRIWNDDFKNYDRTLNGDYIN